MPKKRKMRDPVGEEDYFMYTNPKQMRKYPEMIEKYNINMDDFSDEEEEN